jgi:hypothetical protein
VLEAQTQALDQERVKSILLDMLERLEARSGTIEMRFPYFVRKTAPVSGVQSQLDYEACWRGSVSDEGRYSLWMHVTVPATSLCPCSKEISEYGAHNQRSNISIEAELAGEMAIEELIAIAERSASCEVYGLLKRPDEKYVTEQHTRQRHLPGVRAHAAGGKADPRAGQVTWHERRCGHQGRDAQENGRRRVHYYDGCRGGGIDVRVVPEQRADRAIAGRQPRMVHAVAAPSPAAAIVVVSAIEGARFLFHRRAVAVRASSHADRREVEAARRDPEASG